MDKNERIEVFEDTYLKTKKYKDVLLGCEVIKEDYELSKTSAATNVKVVEGTTFGEASKHIGKKVCVLNFASATNPGGGVKKGSSAQEECLCRESSLFMSLDTKYFFDNYYGYHRSLNNCLYTNRLIFVPKVVVIKDSFGEFLNKPFEVSCISCAAPNLREKPSNSMNPKAGKRIEISNEELEEILVERYRRVIALAETKNVEVLILGAIGCGAFKNNPRVVASAFKKALKMNGSKIEKIVFAIYCGDKEKENLKVFKEILG